MRTDAIPRLSNEDKRTLGLSSFGGALEFYDFVIYVFYAALLHKDLKCKAPLIEPNLRRNLGKWST